MLSTFLLIQRYKFESTNFFGYFIWNVQIVRYTSQESLYPNKEIHMRFTERFLLPTGTCADLNLQYQLPALCDGKVLGGGGHLLTLKQWFLGKVQRWTSSWKISKGLILILPHFLICMPLLPLLLSGLDAFICFFCVSGKKKVRDCCLKQKGEFL